MDDKRVFKCNRCGCCCKNIGYVQEADFLNRGDGVCKYYSDDKKMCMIYDFRPDICRVDKMYKRFKDKMSWDEYIDFNYESCEQLRELEKKKKMGNVEEKEVNNVDNNRNYFD